jgi:signal transduction histidine kinase
VGELMLLKRFIPQSISGQMMAVLAVSFALLLSVLSVFEYLEYDNVIETAESDFTATRLSRIIPILESIKRDEVAGYLVRISHCHDGYEVSSAPYTDAHITDQTAAIAEKLAGKLSIEKRKVQVGSATFTQSNFSYQECGISEMNFPLEGMVVSVQIDPNRWLHAEIHPHEWHLTPNMSDWLLRSTAAFILVGGIAFLFVRRLNQPFKRLTDAASAFGSELEVKELEETGPPDVKRAIRSFNMMQRQVADEMTRRTNTLAAISHDIRSPLTALRVKTELLEDFEVRADHIASIDRMERITSSALAFLKGESRNEPKRLVDLGALADSECAEFREMGAAVDFDSEKTILYSCRPDALARAISNIIENAIKYAGSALVSVTQNESYIDIVISDTGPGIPIDKMEEVLKPFARMSQARESEAGGFGLGLAIAKAVIEGHDGVFELFSNTPSGLIVKMKLPVI